MLKLIFPAFAVMLAAGAASPVQAAGCASGAAVGGAAGHFVGSGHALAGAAIGCAVGHHRANEQTRATTGGTSQAPAGNQTPAPAAH